MRALLFLLTLSLAPIAAGQAALAELQGYLQKMDSLQGQFTQQVYADDGRLLETSSGTFALLRPGYFSWHIRVPDEQVLMAAAGELWHYDVELETATRRPLPVGDAASPLAVLAGDFSVLGEHYVVEQAGPAEFHLLPIQERQDFTALDLKFVDGLPVSMELADTLQRSSLITFSQLQRNPALFPSDFEFEPPTGVDVYYND